MNLSKQVKDHRARGGEPFYAYQGNPLVAADAIALLSGVNFNSVVKMLAAVHLIHDFTGAEMGEIVAFDRLPYLRVNPVSGEDAARARVTRQFCAAIAHRPDYVGLDDILKMRGRFDHH